MRRGRGGTGCRMVPPTKLEEVSSIHKSCCLTGWEMYNMLLSGSSRCELRYRNVKFNPNNIVPYDCKSFTMRIANSGPVWALTYSCQRIPTD